MRIFLFFTLFMTLAVSFICCSDSGTGPEVGDLVDDEYRGLEISYTSEPANAVSETLTPEEGGTVTATGSNGVSYSLEVYPGALVTTTEITVTPLSRLTIGIEDSAAVDSSDCLQGALFEPAGLEFDSTAVLTITYPVSGLDCVLNNGFSIVSIDSASLFYEIIPTVFDAGVPSLTCTLTHFSGYGTDDMNDHDFLEYLITNTIKYAVGFPGIDEIAKLLSYSQQAALAGWDDLVLLAINGVRPILQILVDDAVQDADADPGPIMMGVLGRYFDLAAGFGIEEIMSQLTDAMDRLARAYAARGVALCGEGKHEEGRAILRTVLDWTDSGLVKNPEIYRPQLVQWMEDCGELVFNFGANTNSVVNLVTSEGALEAAIVTFVATVMDFSGAPKEGITIFVGWDRDSSTWTGTTDANGEYTFSVSGSRFTPNGCFDSFSYTFHPQMSLGYGEWEDGQDVIVQFNNLPIFTSLTYDYAFTSSINNMIVSFIGHGTGGGGGCDFPCDNCNGLLTRNYSQVQPSGSMVAIEDTSRVLACRGRVDYELFIHDETGLTVMVLRGIYYCGAESVFDNIIVENCPTGEGCNIMETSICHTSSLSSVWYCALVPDAIYKTELYFPYQDGGFDAFTWGTSDSGTDWSKSASMAITVGIGN